MSQPLAAVFVGSDTLLLQCLEIWREQGQQVVAVVTDAPRLRDYCNQQGLRCLDADSDWLPALQGEVVDHLFAITWLRLLPEPALRLARRSTINFHDGPLPRYAGLNATCWALLHGEQQHGVTWHLVEPAADTGAILLQRRFAVAAEDTAFTLNARCFEAGLESFAELAGLLVSGAAAAVPQDAGQRSYFGRRDRPAALAVLDWSRPAAEVVRLVRALDHGGYKNPLAIAKLRGPAGAVVVGAASVVAGRSAVPGTITAIGDESVRVACADGEVELSRLRCLRNQPIGPVGLASYGIAAGVVLPVPDAATAAAWTELGKAAAAEEDAVTAMLQHLAPLPVPAASPTGGQLQPGHCSIELAGVVGDDALSTAGLCAAFLARSTGSADFLVGLRSAGLLRLVATAPDLAADQAPVACRLLPQQAVGEAVASLRQAFAAAVRRGPVLRELLVRRADVLPATTALSLPVQFCLADAAPALLPGSIAFVLGPGGRVELHYDQSVLTAAAANELLQRLAIFARAVQAQPALPWSQVPLLDQQELQQLLHDWNATAVAAPAEPCVHRQFAAQAAQQPQQQALCYGDQHCTYAELQQRVEQLAAWLQSRGVRAGDRVGICTQRGFGMVTAVLAVLRTGACYVPLDPTYPRERLQFMAGDADLAALITDRASAAAAPVLSAPRIDLDGDATGIASAGPAAADQSDGEALAYVIYTSGSTGRPKGVMVRHRNVANFFLGMDQVLGGPAGVTPGVWLAVTSLSFDISVLELLWTLCRGFTVVLHHGEGAAAQRAAAAAPVATRAVDWSLFYFASDEGEHAVDKYRLLLEGAQFADQHGFAAVWTPERHFHAFGGLYPNPAVASAALATMTKNVAIRAGSCVVPLHHPIRVAEDWALVDNLSRGRVGIAFAAGWHGRDFVLRPENFADRKQVMFDSIRQIQSLWRGESVEFPGHDGKPIAIRTLPRPVQPQLPVWITVAGNPETYRQAGEFGANVLTHLLGQSLEDLQQKLAVYREAWRQAGHAGEGKVTLMLHTYVGNDEASVREIVRGPMKSYLRSSLDLVKQAAWSFPAFKQRVDQPGQMDALLNGGLTPEDFEALLDFSFERYYGSSGLFGTPASCAAMVERLRGMGIDEIACLVDFGVPTDLVLQSLPQLLELKRRCDATGAAAQQQIAAAAAAAPASIPELLTRHRVTHFQCTPSMAGMLLLDPAAPAALRGLQHMLVGGEALPGALAQQLRSLVGTLHDVYGPTETTVWSTTCRVGDDEPVPIGRPLANQRCYVLDQELQPVPLGAAGELWIGGAGVTAGYFRRPELTAERFRPDPFAAGLMYATGDLVRWRADGMLEYLGRKDNQVKLRGYRIELGEIEAVLLRQAGVREAVVVARKDGDEPRLVAYYVPRQPLPKADELRQQLRDSLPDFMVPSQFVAMADLPRTPNQKVDRNALPAPEQLQGQAARPVVAAEDATEATILQIWRQALGTDEVGVEDNFFDSGGHSILAVRVHREIQQQLSATLQVTDLFRFTTVRALARHLQQGKQAPTAAQQAAERARQRRNLLRRS